jgi:hypothetical protein
MTSNPGILNIEKVDGFSVHIVFNNGEVRLLDFNKIFADWGINETDIEYKLFNESEFNKVKLRKSWENISVKLTDENGNEKEYPYEIGVDVLYKYCNF